MTRDNDYEWLLSHITGGECIEARAQLAAKVANSLEERIESGKLPYTVGVFGGWGSGKTTFLALLAKQLENIPNRRMIYFNSWKYAGFMEIVPSLIYKILRFGIAGTDENRNRAAMRVLLCLGKEYSDIFGEWAKERVGLNPVNLFKQVYGELTHLEEASQFVSTKVLEAYYTQVDRAQDVLKEVLGSVKDGESPENAVIVFIDELDRCDPDEAFTVIKQMRVLFSMRKLPIAFVVCANPEPIGLAIKHRYGLESDVGDYEARRILEKFVDSYEDLSETAPLGPLVQSIWEDSFRKFQPWVLAADEAQDTPSFGDDTVKHATGFDTLTTAIPLYANLRVLQKSFQYVAGRAQDNHHLLWTIWHLEIAKQIDPRFREEIRLLAQEIKVIARASYESLGAISFTVTKTEHGRRLISNSDKGRTLFAVFRSYFWEHGNIDLDNLNRKSGDPEIKARAEALNLLLRDWRRMNFIILLSLIPFATAPKEMLSGKHPIDLSVLGQELRSGLDDEFAHLLANY